MTVFFLWSKSYKFSIIPFFSIFFKSRYKSGNVIPLKGKIESNDWISNKFPIVAAYFNMIISFSCNESIISPQIFSILKGIVKSFQFLNFSMSSNSLVINISETQFWIHFIFKNSSSKSLINKGFPPYDLSIKVLIKLGSTLNKESNLS